MAHLNGLSNYGEQIQVEKGYILQNITRWLDLIEEFQVNWSWAPHFAYVLLKKEAEKQTVPRDLSSVVNLLDGGEMVDARTGKEFVRFFEKFGLRECALQPAWGMCETCSGVLYNNDFNFGSGGTAEYKGRTFTKIGKPLPGIDVRIVDEKGVPLKDGEVGVFQIRGKEVTKGYYKNAGENENVFTEDGWFNTGDAGFLSEGSVILTGREKDVVIVNGLNYANAEIEALIGELEEVRSSYVAVCQCVDQNGAEQVIAFFTPQSHTEPVYARRKVLAEVKKKLHIHLAEAIPLPQEEHDQAYRGGGQPSAQNTAQDDPHPAGGAGHLHISHALLLPAVQGSSGNCRRFSPCGPWLTPVPGRRRESPLQRPPLPPRGRYGRRRSP